MLMKKMNYRKQRENIRYHIIKLFAQKLSSLPPKACKTKRSANALTFPARLFPNGGSAFSIYVSQGLRISRDGADRPVFPPQVVVEIKALACELPTQRNLPFSRFSRNEIAREAVRCGIVASISGTTVWRWLSADAIKPWSYRVWIFPRDPHFAEKAGVVLDLYQGLWQKEPLGDDDFILSADEKTSIQARRRIHPGTPPAPGRHRRLEFEYERAGALAYMAAWDVRRAKVFGLCEKTTGIDSYRRLVDLVMRQEPYRSARRVFWITDNGSSHRGDTSIQRLSQWYTNAIQVHTPVHASWLNQIEIYFSVVQRKVLTPNDFNDLIEVENRLLEFQDYYELAAKPFKWKFTRENLTQVLEKLSYDNYEQKAA